jgi:hypothetical protein
LLSAPLDILEIILLKISVLWEHSGAESGPDTTKLKLDSVILARLSDTITLLQFEHVSSKVDYIRLK